MQKKKPTDKLTDYTTNELLSELLKRGNVPLLPACEEDEVKINLFKEFWQQLSVSEIFCALRGKSVQGYETGNRKKEHALKVSS